VVYEYARWGRYRLELVRPSGADDARVARPCERQTFVSIGPVTWAPTLTAGALLWHPIPPCSPATRHRPACSCGDHPHQQTRFGGSPAACASRPTNVSRSAGVSVQNRGSDDSGSAVASKDHRPARHDPRRTVMYREVWRRISIVCFIPCRRWRRNHAVLNNRHASTDGSTSDASTRSSPRPPIRCRVAPCRGRQLDRRWI